MHRLFSVFWLRRRRPSRSTLFPYTTLFRSLCAAGLWLTGCATEDNASRPSPRTSAVAPQTADTPTTPVAGEDRKSTRLNSSHVAISYAVFCLKQRPESVTDRPGLRYAWTHH